MKPDYIIELITLTLITLSLFIMTGATIYQSRRRWGWPWALEIPEGMNGRWKLDWGLSAFLLLLSVDYAAMLYEHARREDIGDWSLPIHFIMALASLTVVLYMYHEFTKQRGE